MRLSFYSFLHFCHLLSDKKFNKIKEKEKNGYYQIKCSKYFNKHWYLKTYPDVEKAKVDPIEHYLKFGWKEGRNPGPHFDTLLYLNKYVDVKNKGHNPLLHYERSGKKEGRVVFDADIGFIKKEPTIFDKKTVYHNPKISIIVASYNYEQYISQTLDSLVGQTYKNFEIIVVDDGSTDNSEKIIKKYVKKYHNISLYRHENGENKGLTATVLLGIQKSTGDYIAFCESDDYWAPNHLEKKIQIINSYRHPRVIVNYVQMFGNQDRCRFIQEKYQKTAEKILNKTKCKIKFEDFRKQNLVMTFSCCMVEKKLLNKIDIEHNPCEQLLDLWIWRQLAIKYPFFVMPERLTFWRMHQSFTTQAVIDGKRFLAIQDEFLKRKYLIYSFLQGWRNKVKNKDLKKIEKSKFFDEKYYIKTYPEVKNKIISPALHYLLIGWKEGKNPSANFNTNFYLEINDDVKKANINPLLHYLSSGKKEARIFKPCKLRTIIPQKKGNFKIGVIYSCITGGYDSIQEHYYVDENWDYVLFTDNDELIKKQIVGHWKILPLQYGEKDNIRNARWHKTHPHILFPNYQYSVWIDGNINICGPFLFKRLAYLIKKGALISVPSHPIRNCIYQEAQKLKRVKKDFLEIIDKQVTLLQEKGFPKKNGLNETNIVFRLHNNKECVKMMEEWWWWIENYSRRDQLSFNYVLWKFKYKMVNFCSKKGVRYNPKNFFLVHGRAHNGKVKIECQVTPAKTISIIIPVFNALEDLKKLFKTMENSNFSENIDVILVNDYSSNETSIFLKEYIKGRNNWKLLENTENLGFVKTCNRGMKEAKGDIVVLLNSDTMIPPRWEERILMCFNSDLEIGTASPIASASGLWDMPIIDGMTFEQMDEHIEKVSDKEYPILLCPEGFCIAIRKEVLETLGMLDEIFGRGYCEETELDLRAMNAGWKTCLIDNLYVYHKRHASFGTKAREEQIAKNKKILWGRWGNLYNMQMQITPTSAVIEKIKQRVYGKIS